MKMTTIFGEKIDSPCTGCIVKDNSKFKEGRIYQTHLWDLSQDFEIAYPGMVVISALRHVSNYIDLTSEEIKELHQLISQTKIALRNIFNIEEMAYMFYEKSDGHFHFVIIPLHGLVKIKDKYAVLSELIQQKPTLRKNTKNMTLVTETITKLRKFFHQ